MNNALERIDDSGGARFGVEELLAQAMVNIIKKLPWTATQKADWLLEKTDQHDDVFPEVPEAFLADNVLPEVAEIYYQKLQAKWDALPPLNSHSRLEKNFQYSGWFFPLLEHAKATNNTTRIIELKAKVATDIRDYFELMELNTAQKNLDAAEHWLAKIKIEGEKKAGTNKALALEAETILLQAQQRFSEAADLLWQKFRITRHLLDYLTMQSSPNNRMVPSRPAINRQKSICFKICNKSI